MFCSPHLSNKEVQLSITGGPKNQETTPVKNIFLMFWGSLAFHPGSFLYDDLWITSHPIHVSFCDKPLVEDRLGIDLLLLFSYRYILIWTHFNLLLVLSSYCSSHLGVMMGISWKGGDSDISLMEIRIQKASQDWGILVTYRCPQFSKWKRQASVPSGNVLRTEKSPFQAFWVEWNSDLKRNWNPFY